jgi:hypothetical protein
VAAAAEAARADGELAISPLTSGAALAGSWRPVPDAAGGGPGSYASTIPFLLATRSADTPAHIAAVLAARLAGADGEAAGICRAAVTGPGYLSLTVSPEALGRLAARISQAGPGCARSTALRGTMVTAPARTVLAAADSWDEAWRWLAAELAGRLASAAGAEVSWTDPPDGPALAKPAQTKPARTMPAGTTPAETTPALPEPALPEPALPEPALPEAGRAEAGRAEPSRAEVGPAGLSRAEPGRAELDLSEPGRAELDLSEPGRAEPGQAEPGAVAVAVAFAGTDAIRYALTRAVPSGTGPGRRIRAIDPRAAAAQHLGNPFYAVRYAHAHAASILRWSAHLGLPAADAAQFQPRLLAHPREQALLDAMSWLPERVAGAARRGQPHVLASYLEDLTGTYLDWQECCPLGQPGAFPPGPDNPPGPGQPPGPHQPAGPGQPSGSHQPARPDQQPGPGQPGTQLRQARLLLADAARTVLGTGLGLLGVAAPDGISQLDGQLGGQIDGPHPTSKEAR